jgi:hypothetical protein
LSILSDQENYIIGCVLENLSNFVVGVADYVAVLVYGYMSDVKYYKYPINITTRLLNNKILYFNK